jgi:hypothetical protein
MAPDPASIRSRHRWWLALATAIVFAGTVTHTWARWGELRVDAGGALDRAARVAGGQLLYRDVQSPYGPLGTYAAAAAFRAFGVHLSTAYGLCIAVLALQGWLLWSIGRRVLSEGEAAFAVIMFWFLMAIQPGLTSWLLPNTFATVFGAFFATATLALSLSSHGRRSLAYLTVASAAAALAGLAKVEFGVAAVGAIMVSIAVAPPPRGERTRAFAAAVAPGATLTLVVAAALCALVPVEQLVGDNLYRQRTLALVVPATRGWAEFPLWPMLREAVLRYGVELPVRAAVFAAGGAMLAAGRGWRRWAGGALALAALLPPLLPGYPQLREFLGLRRGLPYYWAPAAWALVGAVAAVAHVRSPTPRTRAVLVIAVFAVLLSLRWNFRLRLASYYGFLGPILLLLVVRTVASSLLRRTLPPWATVAVFVVPLAAAETANLQAFAQRSFALEFPRGTIIDTPARAAPIQQVVELIRRATAPSDFVAVIPEERIINFLSERRNPTRDSGIGPGWLATPADEAAYVAELQARPPAMIVLSARRYTEFGYGELATYNPLVADYIARAYRKRRSFGVGFESYAVYVPNHSSTRR